MSLINFIVENWDILLAAAAIIGVTIFAVIKQEKAIIFKMLYALVTEAEKQYGSGTGELKLSAVISQLQEKMPTVAGAIPVKTLEKWVEQALTEAKEKWLKNINVASYIAPEDSE